MRRFQKQQILDIMSSLHILHGEIRDRLDGQNYQTVQNALADCQEAAIQVGEVIEQLEGAGTGAVSFLEQYCENLYHNSVQMQEVSAKKVYKSLESSLIRAENEVKHIPVRLEAVFLPYKVSMWDSLESVWMAADQAPDCDAYVIPIPYYDKKPDGSFGKEHYEGDAYPDYVPVTDYRDYDFENRRPDMIFIHNPYDQFNNVTSVHPFFYSKNLKQFTDSLVYIPYYCTSGSMNEAQGYAVSYYYADYIVIQSEKYRKFFDPNLPREKFLPLGSPKFDKVIRLCQNPPEPPVAWKEKMAGKKVYFYNTSINGMLANTEVFLKKMRYVFQCFAECENACLLWRPHPLLESTFDSMRKKYKPVYEKLKEYFFEENLGIYDDTPEIEPTIALCDAYVGDAGTSVVSLFGVAGKPVFILNNYIDSKPGEDDWRGEIITSAFAYGNNQWTITQGNKLYYSPENNYQFQYCCDLSDYASGNYYLCIISIQGKNYACPANAQDILVVDDRGIQKKIKLQRYVERQGAFYGAIGCGDYLFLIPQYYPAIVRYDTVREEVTYFDKNVDVFRGTAEGKWRRGGYCVYNGYLFIASPMDNRILAIHAKTGKEQILTTKADNACGCAILLSDGTDLWFLPYSGNVITRWNPESGEVHEYADYPAELQCRHPVLDYETTERPFHWAAFCGDYVYLPAWQANMHIRLDKKTGMMTEWKMPFEQPDGWKNGYFFSGAKGYFQQVKGNSGAKVYSFYSIFNRKQYDINLETNEVREIHRNFDRDELERHESGFQEQSEWLQYTCQENVFNSLSDFLDGNITGNQFDQDQAIRVYEKIAANNDGTSGEKIYQFIYNKLVP